MSGDINVPIVLKQNGVATYYNTISHMKVLQLRHSFRKTNDKIKLSTTKQVLLLYKYNTYTKYLKDITGRLAHYYSSRDDKKMSWKADRSTILTWPTIQLLYCGLTCGISEHMCIYVMVIDFWVRDTYFYAFSIA